MRFKINSFFRTYPYCKMLGISDCSVETNRRNAFRHMESCHRYGVMLGSEAEIKYQFPVSSDKIVYMEPVVLFTLEEFFFIKCVVKGDEFISWYVYSSSKPSDEQHFRIKFELADCKNVRTRTSWWKLFILNSHVCF